MNLEEYIKGISFLYLQPNRQMADWERVAPEPFCQYSDQTIIEFSNTVLPENSAETKQLLFDVCAIPKMSTLAIGAIINRAVSLMKGGEAYVCVGTWHGFSLFAGMVGNPDKTCVGVDNFSEFGGPRTEFLERFNNMKAGCHQFFDMGYQEFFEVGLKEPIRVYMYDGPHDYENQLLGLQLAEPFFSPSCVVIVDDTNLDAPRQATADFIAQSKNKYRTLLDARTAGNCHATMWNGLWIGQREE